MKTITIPDDDYEEVRVEDGELTIELSDDAARYLERKGFSQRAE